jgi:molecular chaperone DnaK
MVVIPVQDDSERRRHERITVSVIIDYETADQFFQDYAMNLSLGGVFIRTNERMPLGARLKIHFSIPEHDEFIDGWGTVVRIENSDDPDELPGLGIAFDKLDSKASGIIDTLVAPD